MTRPSQDANKEQDKDKKPKLSEAEVKAAKKIESAPDVAAKLQAADEFIKKHPQSTLRPQIARHVAGHVVRVQDPAQRITFSENYLGLFKEPGDADIIDPFLIDAYINANRFDDAFRVASRWTDKNPERIGPLTQLALVGIEQAKRNNPKFVPQSQKYGAEAIELIEAGRKPANMDDARWNEYRTRWLPQLYQSLGVVSLIGGNKADAQAKILKASTLDPSEPANFWFLGNIKNDEYQDMALQYKAMPPGPAQDELLKKINAQLDEVIDLYAHVVALSDGKPDYKQLHDQAMKDLESYYKFRNNGSTDGLKQLIDKYKRPSATP